MKTIKKFEQILKADENLSVEYQSLVETKDSEKIVKFMKNHGVSDDDIKALKNKELNDDELDGITGGWSWSWRWSSKPEDIYN